MPFRHVLLCLLAVAPGVTAAPPTLTYLFPAGAQRGTTVEVTAGGTFERWPVKAWVSGQGVEVKPAGDKGKLSVTVAADAVPGTYWIRLHDEQGAGIPRPFVVGTLPEVLEREPNDDRRKPQVLEPSVVVNGRLNPAGDVDGFAVKLTKGQTLVASLEANRLLGSPMDAVLQVVSADGFVLEENNDYHDLDPQIVFTAPADGSYVVRTFAFPATPDSGIRFAGGETYVYRLTLTAGGFADHVLPLAVSRSDPGQVELHGWNVPDEAKKLSVVPDGDADSVTVWHPQLGNTASVRLEPHATAIETEPNDRQHPQSISLPVTVSGRIDPPGDVDVYRFQGRKGQKLFFQVESRALGYPLDAVLRLTDAAGKVLARVDDPGGRRDANRDPELAFTVPADGAYQIEVHDLNGQGGFRYVYRLRAVAAEPDYELTVAADRFTLTPGKPLEVPVTVVRRNGFESEVEVNVEGLPEGVTAEPVKAGKAAKTATLRLNASTGPVSGPIHVLGKAPGPPQLVRSARAVLPGLGASTRDLWLTIVKPGSPAEKPAKAK